MTWAPPRSSTRAWVVYDLANTVFALGVVGLYLPDWLTARGLPDTALALVQGVAGVVVIVASPWVGARSDHRGRRLPTLLTTTLLAVAATAGLGSGPEELTLLLLGVALVGVNVGSVVYDALLPDVSLPGERGRVSGLGVAVGYVGSFLGLGIGTVTLDLLDWGYAATFRALALAFLAFSLPTFLWVRERPRPAMPGRPPGPAEAAQHLVRAWRRAARFPGVVRFLMGRFLYTDAINTLIGGFLTIFIIEELGMDRAFTRNLLAVAIAAAIVGGVLGGRLVEWLGPRRALEAVLVLWLLAISSGVTAAATGRVGLAWVIGPLGGVALGATWASDRVLMARISPPRHLGEFYGLYATVGRFATVLGPLMWALVVDGLGWGRQAAMSMLGGFVALALAVVHRVDDHERGWRPEEQ